MIFKNNILYKNIIFYEKLNNIYIFNNTNIKINKLMITLKIPSNIKYNYGFITMLILLEKYTNNLPIFLKDINTLSKKRSIKIGLLILLKNELIDRYMQLCMYHSIPKINKNSITFKMSIKNYNLFYNNNIILSNTIFSFDINIFQYYTYINEFIYNIEFIFYINTKNILINKFITNQYNLDIMIEDNSVVEDLSNITETNVLLEFGDELYSDDEDKEEIESAINYIALSENIDNKNNREKEDIFILNYVLSDTK